MTKKEQEQTTDIIPVIAETKDIKSLIYVVRGQQVMMDSDLAMLYQVDTKVFNQAVSRNIKRFPENFRFQLTKEEFDALRSQVATSNGRGGRRYRPWDPLLSGLWCRQQRCDTEISIYLCLLLQDFALNSITFSYIY